MHCACNDATTFSTVHRRDLYRKKARGFGRGPRRSPSAAPDYKNPKRSHAAQQRV